MSHLTFAVKREMGQPSLFDFGVGKVNEGGRIPIPVIPASLGTAQPVSQATSHTGKPKKVGTTSGVAAKEALERQRAAESEGGSEERGESDGEPGVGDTEGEDGHSENSNDEPLPG